jgi:L-ascorbate metabolism protein UlaG (beta-lactamase superfamily)
MFRSFRASLALAALTAGAAAQAAPDHVDITWMSITNMYFELGGQKIVADGYITRLPAELFQSGDNIYGTTVRAARPDVAAVKEVLDALGSKPAVNLLLTGHNHFDHSFDTGAWAKLSGARIIGARTACLQTRAQGIPGKRCTPVVGGEVYKLEPGVNMHVIRWNHSGGPNLNPKLHEPRELDLLPVADASGALHAGVLEDFPNGGGNRAYLFTVDGPSGRFSWFFQDSGSPVDLEEPIIMAGRNYGAPLDNLRAAMKAAGIETVDLWIATGGRDMAALVLPVLRPKAYLPVHWDGLFGAFKSGPAEPYADPQLAAFLAEQGVRLVVPVQYMDKWRLDKDGISTVDNSKVKQKLGFH